MSEKNEPNKKPVQKRIRNRTFERKPYPPDPPPKKQIKAVSSEKFLKDFKEHNSTLKGFQKPSK